jgi:hypothetical protein
LAWTSPICTTFEAYNHTPHDPKGIFEKKSNLCLLHHFKFSKTAIFYSLGQLRVNGIWENHLALGQE